MLPKLKDKEHVRTVQPFPADYDRLRPITTDCERLTLEEKKILIYLLDNEKITRKKATEVLNVKNTKAYETLTSLVEKNLIQREGKGRSTYYVIKNKSEKS